MVVDYVWVWGHYGGDFCGVVWIMVVDVLATGDPGVFGIYIYILVQGIGYVLWLPRREAWPRFLDSASWARA